MTTGERPGAVLLDVDGTLIDSNYLHVRAWSLALVDVDRPTPTWRIHRAIGMDSDALLESLLGGQVDRLGDQVKRLHAEEYERLTPQLRTFDGARALLSRIRDRGLQSVLATSAPEDELAYQRATLDCEDLITQITSAADVDDAKPDPEVVQAALAKAGVPADRAVFVGDAVWDMKAAVRAGVRPIALLSGGIGAQELREAGASEIYEDPADLLDHFDDSLLGTL